MDTSHANPQSAEPPSYEISVGSTTPHRLNPPQVASGSGSLSTLNEAAAASSAQTTNPVSLAYNSSSDQPNDLPPDYVSAHIPTHNIQYSFSTSGFNSMKLVPLGGSGSIRPLYYISVHLNCFMPLAHITSIHRGANEAGEKVGEFELGIIAAPSRLHVNNMRTTVDEVLTKESGTRSEGQWNWRPPPPNVGSSITWDFTKRPNLCYKLGDRRTLFATFNQPLPHELHRTARLDVTPVGHGLLDHIVVSLLVIERKRLTPAEHKVLKELFN